MPVRGKSKLHAYKINVCLYDADAKPHVIRDVVISAKQELTSLEVPANIDVKAIYINEGQHGYAKVRFDSESIAWITANLHKVESPLSRMAIWRYFWHLVMDRRMSSV
jgi:aminopeptidase N